MRFFETARERFRRCLVLTATLVLLVSVAAARAKAQARLPIDEVFLIDVSGSMDGKAHHTQIFPRVKQAIKDFVAKTDPGTNILFLPFAERVRDQKRFTITSPPDIAAVDEYVDSLVANGESTAVYNSIGVALDRVKQLRGNPDSRAVVLYVYTDGDDNVSHMSIAQILDAFSLARGKYDWLFYTELGVPRNAERAAEFDKHDNTRYVSEKVGEVHPLMQVQTLLPLLNFGNLLVEPNATRVEKFELRSHQPLAPGFQIAVETDFPALKQMGVLADVKPDHVTADGKPVAFGISLVNVASMKDSSAKEYRGKLKLTPNDPLVIVVPDEVDTVFRYEPAHVVSVTTAPGQPLPIDVGRFTSNRPLTVRLPLRFAFSLTAKADSQNVDVELSQALNNPEPLRLGSDVAINTLGKAPTGTITPAQREVELVIQPRAGLKPGAYSGTVELTSDAQLQGQGLGVDRQTGKRSIAWKFVVDKAPLPLWAWGLVLALLAGAAVAAIAWMRRPPVFGDLQISVQRPQPEDIDLSTKHRATFGKGGDYARDSDVRFVIKAERLTDGVAAMLDPADGDVTLERAGARAMPIVGKEQVYSGDIISFGDYRMQLSSFSLVNS